MMGCCSAAVSVSPGNSNGIVALGFAFGLIDLLSLLVQEVAFDRGRWCNEVFVDMRGCEFWPGGVVT